MVVIRLQSSDGEIFETDVEIAKSSNTIAHMIEDLGLDNEDVTNNIVPLPNVHSDILRRFLQWASHHKDDPIPGDDEENKGKRSDDISAWDADFLKVDQGTLFDLILAADFLDAEGLLNAACKSVSNMIEGKSPEELQETFNITKDYTKAEVEDVRNEKEIA